jgi:hypothetical protein
MTDDFEARLQELFGDPHATHEFREREPETRLETALRIFEAAGNLPGRFGESRVAEGLVRLVNPGQSDDLTFLNDPKLNEVLRLRVIASMKTVFKDCFLPLCTPHLRHLEEEGGGPLNSVCYMWWEHVPLFGDPAKPERKNIDAAVLDVMKDTLRMPSVAVQESALHGLGHWVPEYPAVVEPIIDDYLKNANVEREELRVYAKKARTGMIN